jgi:anti-anti-sigma factor
MTVVHNTNSSTPNPASLDHPFSCDGVSLSNRSQGGATVVAASGELDASNIHYLGDYVHRCLRGDRHFVLDLTELSFLGAQGIQALFSIDEKCGEAGVEWALVPSHPVSRLLRICDKDRRLPATSSVGHAVQRFSSTSAPRHLLKLVAKSS